MKKFHKRAAVFLTAATLAGLPAGAFFYSSPGSLTVWADNVEVESSEESSPEDVDFSDGSEEILNLINRKFPLFSLLDIRELDADNIEALEELLKKQEHPDPG